MPSTTGPGTGARAGSGTSGAPPRGVSAAQRRINPNAVAALAAHAAVGCAGGGGTDMVGPVVRACLLLNRWCATALLLLHLLLLLLLLLYSRKPGRQSVQTDAAHRTKHAAHNCYHASMVVRQ